LESEAEQLLAYKCCNTKIFMPKSEQGFIKCKRLAFLSPNMLIFGSTCRKRPVDAETLWSWRSCLRSRDPELSGFFTAHDLRDGATGASREPSEGATQLMGRSHPAG
jgi:hypothetical protein